MVRTGPTSSVDEKQGGPDGIVEFRRQKTLIKTDALQEAIFNSAYFSSIATDEKGVIQIFNVGAERMLGYAAADVVNKITPADISDPQELIARAAALSRELHRSITPGFEALVFKASRGMEDIYELTYIRKDGSRFPAIVSVTALRDAQENIIGYLLIGTDNTAHKQAEEALLKSGALQSAIFNSANFSSIATDAKGVIQIFNVGAERMLGYAAAEVVNRITPADISDPMEVIVRAKALSVELGTPITPGFEALVFKASRGIEDIYELTYFRKDGSRFPAIVSVTALRDAHENIIGYLLIGTDNTARKQVEEVRAQLDQRLRDQQFYTRSLIESNIDALMTTDPRGIISDVNQQMMALTGRTRDELIGAPCNIFFTDPARADAAIKRVLTENRVSNYELTVRAQSGEETVVSYNAAIFHDRERNVQGVFAAARDITERKRAEQSLQETSQELQRTLDFVEERNRDISLLGEMTGVLHSCLTVEETFTPIAKYCEQLFPNEAGAMYLMNSSGNFMEEVICFGAWTPHEPVFVLDDCWALRRGQIYPVTDPQSGILCKHVVSAQDGAHPYVCLPMSAHHEITGLFHLQFGATKSGEAGQEKRLEAKRLIAIAMVEQITLSVSNLKLRDTLRQQSTRDPLTGLYNRRFMEEFVEREFARTRRRGTPLAFMMVDVDHFKQFNDTFGHEAGDLVLCELAKIMKTSVRDNDIVCRMGGEEFGVVMPEASIEIAHKRAEGLREGAHALRLKLGSQDLGQLSISIGISAFPDHGGDFAALSAAADRALYCAKDTGRNKSMVAEAVVSGAIAGEEKKIAPVPAASGNTGNG